MTFDPAAHQATSAAAPPAKKNKTKAELKQERKDKAAAAAAVKDAKEQAPPAVDKTTPPARQIVLLELPLGCHHPGYAAPYVEVGNLRPRQAAAMNFLWSSLSADGVRCDKGRSRHPAGSVVETSADVVRFMLDKVADAIEKQTGKDLTTDFGFVFR